MTPPPASDRTTTALAEFLRASRAAILERWERQARRQPKAQQLPEGALRDSIPELLDEIGAEAALPFERVQTTALDDIASNHALQRLHHGYSVGELVREYGMVRDLHILSAGYSRSPNVTSELPEMTATYCLPSTAYVIGPITICPPRLAFQSGAPVRASSAWK